MVGLKVPIAQWVLPNVKRCKRKDLEPFEETVTYVSTLNARKQHTMAVNMMSSTNTSPQMFEVSSPCAQVWKKLMGTRSTQGAFKYSTWELHNCNRSQSISKHQNCLPHEPAPSLNLQTDIVQHCTWH